MKNTFLILLISGYSALMISENVIAQAPPLRDQISLNGIWDFTTETGEKATIPVPEFWDAAPGFTKRVNREYTNDRGEKSVREVSLPSTTIGIYERDITIPAEWEGKTIMLEFEGVNHIAEVMIGDKLLLTHTGGWTPFRADITSLVSPGKKAPLRVVVKGGSHSPIVDSEGYPQWPVGWYGQESRWGIIFDTWLRAYGNVYIEDAFIRTSWRNKDICVDYELINNTSGYQDIEISGEVKAKDTGKPVLTVKSGKLSLNPGERKKVSIKSDWEDPELWNPETPVLYLLTSSIIKGNEIIDRETRRFGFREIWIEGTMLMLNGNRLNLRGTSINTHGQGYNS